MSQETQPRERQTTLLSLFTQNIRAGCLSGNWVSWHGVVEYISRNPFADRLTLGEISISSCREFRSFFTGLQYRTRAGTVRKLNGKDLGVTVKLKQRSAYQRVKLAYLVYRSLYAPELPFLVKRSESDFLGVFTKEAVELKNEETLWPGVLIGELEVADFEIRNENMRYAIDSYAWETTKGTFMMFGPLSLVNHVCSGSSFRWSYNYKTGVVSLKARGHVKIEAGGEIRVFYSLSSKQWYRTKGSCNCPRCCRKA